MLPFKKTDFQHFFTTTTWQKGNRYWKSRRVFNCDILQGEDNRYAITGRVIGSGQTYTTTIHIHSRPRLGFSTHCTCPVEFRCKHSAALLLQALLGEEKPHFNEQGADENALTRVPDSLQKAEKTRASKQVQPARSAPPDLPEALGSWLRQVRSAAQKNTPRATQSPQCVLYLLEPMRGKAGEEQLRLKLASARLLKDGGYGKLYSFRSQDLHKTYVQAEDKVLLKSLEELACERRRGFSFSSVDQFWLQQKEGIPLLFERLLATGRCHWQSPQGPALYLAEARAGELRWVMDDDGGQRLSLDLGEEPDKQLLPLTEPWYVDTQSGACGPVQVQSDMPPALLGALLAAPRLEPEYIEAIKHALGDVLPPTLQPQALRKRVEKNFSPEPRLYLFTHELEMKEELDDWRYWDFPDSVIFPAAALSFYYGPYQISAYGQSDTHLSFFDSERQQVVEIHRKPKQEKDYIKQLEAYGFTPLARASFINDCYQLDEKEKTFSLLLNDMSDEELLSDEYAREQINYLLMAFSMSEVPRLKQQGWQVEYSDDYAFQVLDDELLDEWYTEVDEGSGIDWFGLELGIQVDGQKINLLPILVDMLHQMRGADELGQLKELPDETVLTLRIDDTRILPVPLKRLRTIIETLVELFDENPLDEDGRLRLMQLQAAQLAELEAGMRAADMRWLGGERLLALGRKLKDFREVSAVEPPENFRAELRPYQQEGLNWLQFLREYSLAGILADDMGLGKTVQTLAHILSEKKAGRLDKPALVIAPTSLMTNWRLEALRFAPDLRVLTLQGMERKDHFDKIAEQDLVLTTYPLLPRDKAVLLAHEYHLLILDEAQNIKNPKAKATQIAHQIKAKHRLCLTGTPMENNLGELWSLFHFLMPGLLGDTRQFRRLFRTPIEKQQDSERNHALSKRIAPFMLRRTKQQVVTELPEKTEIIRTAELDGAQRDLYETIRLTMHERVQQEIASKGMSRSHIIILDALLKLRQVCCDPRLLKMASAKKVKQSAKLNLLMDLLPEMVEEGRKILLFSQFTSMLALIEDECKKHRIAYTKLTGQTRKREEAIQAFQEGDSPLFLISLKAGGTGLNLTAADTVIHYDPWWNPAVENQATDRAHRIGQDKKVFVYKLLTENTVEQKIQEMQQRKRALADALFGEGDKQGGALTQADLEILFQPLSPFAQIDR